MSERDVAGELVARVVDPSIFDRLTGPRIEYAQSPDGKEQTRTCRGCGKSETVKVEIIGKQRRFPGLLNFERDHIRCGRTTK